jgi:hypothetical protein
MQILRDSTRKRRSLDIKIQSLTTKETKSKAHMQVHTNKESREKQPGPNRAETGLGRPAQPFPGPVWRPLWPSRLSGYL